ncbi:F1F0 ATP synthase subunit d [Ascoidea rubescens DSM 1968]|uniref:ATP synthase subunit d, mitochondrial n=1 Tax=Ascoidea rubescens DSM 1968 TaxID=1344418 RepID=A0A1D2VAL7_9ASCO|nr:ATP synthase subunit D, mitochondrial [Ascoidea rubescens DSM 1968]ODV58718.1 ATP synthase subunit D, mitochondrial [Ascoidea rubescens DSM 1968]
MSLKAAVKLDWAKVVSSLGLKGQSAASLQAFKKRNDEAKRVAYELNLQDKPIDFAYYKSVLKNQDIISKIESSINDFKPITYDISDQVSAIETFKQTALESAEQTESLILKEIEDLNKTLENIQKSRPFEQLTVDDVVAAKPDIDEKVTQMVKQGRWELPAYYDKFGKLVIM